MSRESLFAKGTMSTSETGAELDAEVAENVMGWRPYSKRGAHKNGSTWVHPSGYSTSYGAWPKYSTDIAAAWLVVEKLIALGFYPDLVTTHAGEGGGLAWRCVIDRCTDCLIGRGADDEDALDPFPVSESARTAPHAICLAALAARGALPHEPAVGETQPPRDATANVNHGARP